MDKTKFEMPKLKNYAVAVCETFASVGNRKVELTIVRASNWQEALVGHYLMWADSMAKKSGGTRGDYANPLHVGLIDGLPGDIELAKEKYLEQTGILFDAKECPPET